MVRGLLAEEIYLHAILWLSIKIQELRYQM